MREQARIQLRGDSVLFQSSWNSRFDPKIEYGLVVLYKDDPAYAMMRQMFAAFTKEHVMTWFERVDAEYSDQELAAFEILSLQVLGHAGSGNNELADVYKVANVCESCGRTEYQQVRNLVLNFSLQDEDPVELGFFEHDLCQTDFGEIVVSDRVRFLVESHNIRGVRLRPVESYTPDTTAHRPYFQLLVDLTIGPIIEPSRILRLEWCDKSKNYRQILLDAWPGSRESEFHFGRDTARDVDIMITTDCFGRGPNYVGKLIVSQHFYQLLKQHDITGYWVQPAHLD